MTYVMPLMILRPYKEVVSACNEDLALIARELYSSPTRKGCRYDYDQCLQMAAHIIEIQKLKKQKDVAIFAHSYVSSEILHYIADVRGDSLHLAEQAKFRTERNFVFAAVRFMAETAKILNPSRSVYLCAEDGGCSLAESITAEIVIDMRKKFPRSTFVCYVNTSAEVKANCDVCVTSANALEVILNIPNEEIYFLPDKFMAQNLANAIARLDSKKKIEFYHGTCVVHETFSVEEVAYWRKKIPGIKVLAHPECNPEVVAKADFVGSTSQIAKDIRESDKEMFLALTECGLATHLQTEGLGKKEIIGTCSICPYMKSNSLLSIRRTLEDLNENLAIQIPESVQSAALEALKQMWRLSIRPQA